MRSRGDYSFNHGLLKSKKGLSDVLTTMLIILLVLVAVGIIWVVVRNVILKGAEDIELEKFNFNLDIRSAYLDKQSNLDVVRVAVRRGAGGEGLAGIRFTFSNGSDNYISDRKIVLEETGEGFFVFSSLELDVNVASLQDVSVAPIYDISGGERTGDILDTQEIGSSAPPGTGGSGGGAVCGDSICASGEEEYCSFDCGSGGGGGGGGGTATCGNEIIESGENCEGANLNGQTCATLGYAGGTLNCYPPGSINECKYDVRLCVGATPASCDGTWNPPEDQGVECDGTPLPNGCGSSCICNAGFSPNGNGGCTLDPPINTGIIFSIWPAGAQKYFDSEKLPKNAVEIAPYTNYYVNFTTSSETRCLRITFAEYLPDINRSYLRLLFEANINAGEGYNVWEAGNCGQ